MTTSIDTRIAAIAARQHSLFARRQVREISAEALVRRVKSGVLVAESRNVLRVAAATRTDEQRVMAGVLDLPGDAIAWAGTATWLWELPGFALRGIHIATPRAHHRASPLAIVHHPRLWLPDHVTVRRGIPVPSLAWTIYSLAGKVPRSRLLWLVDRVGNRSPSTLCQLHELLPMLAESGRNGITDLRAALAENPPGVRPLGSGNERRFIEVMAGAGLRGFRKQVDIGGHEWLGRVDFLCDETGVIFEVDSEEHHTSPADAAADAKRDDAMVAAGAPAVVRVWSQLLWRDPTEAIAIVRTERRRHRRAA